MRFRSERKLICLTPVKDEAWILDRFLKCASLWADHIIVADQNSSDDTRKIAAAYEKVILIHNESQAFNEPERQKLLISEARKIPGPKILLALDADEILTSNWMKSPEWSTLLEAPLGTVFRFQCVNIRPDMESCWIPPIDFAWGIVEDGSEHKGCKIHSPRIPIPEKAPSILMRDIKVLHYQYTDWERMRSKHRWYQAWELLHNNRPSTVSLYRQYHHMFSVSSDAIRKIPKEWFKGYEEQGIDMTSVWRDACYRWDKELLKMMSDYGVSCFAKAAIWDLDWSLLAGQLGYSDTSRFKDPRGWLQKMLHDWLKNTQPYANALSIRVIDEVLKLFRI